MTQDEIITLLHSKREYYKMKGKTLHASIIYRAIQDIAKQSRTQRDNQRKEANNVAVFSDQADAL